MYSINYTHQFKKDMRKCAKRGLDIEEIKTAIKILSETDALPDVIREPALAFLFDKSYHFFVINGCSAKKD